MIKIYKYIEDADIYAIYNRRTRHFFVSTNPDAERGRIYITD